MTWIVTGKFFPPLVKGASSSASVQTRFGLELALSLFDESATILGGSEVPDGLKSTFQDLEDVSAIGEVMALMGADFNGESPDTAARELVKELRWVLKLAISLDSALPRLRKRQEITRREQMFQSSLSALGMNEAKPQPVALEDHGDLLRQLWK